MTVLSTILSVIGFTLQIGKIPESEIGKIPKSITLSATSADSNVSDKFAQISVM